MSEEIAISAIVTAFRRPEQTCLTLERISGCSPRPNEILVHVDGNESECASVIKNCFPEVKVLLSKVCIGPGGGRNKLLAASMNELVASFDDNSYPADIDFFGRAAWILEQCPDVPLIACSIFHRGEEAPEERLILVNTASFVGCGVVYRRSAFLETGGYVPLQFAYGMEEEDLSLRLLDEGKQLVFSPWLRVFHDTDLSHHSDERLTAAQIANCALLAFLRYPKRYWLYGAVQVANRIRWSLTHNRKKGVAAGLAQIPLLLTRHRNLRSPVSGQTIRMKRKGTLPSPPSVSQDLQAYHDWSKRPL